MTIPLRLLNYFPSECITITDKPCEIHGLLSFILSGRTNRISKTDKYRSQTYLSEYLVWKYLMQTVQIWRDVKQI